MTWPTARSVLLVSDDGRCLELLASELSAMGCRVFCARDLEQAAELVRARLTARFLLIFIGEDLIPPAELRAEMAARLPGWMVQGDELIESSRAPVRLVN